MKMKPALLPILALVFATALPILTPPARAQVAGAPAFVDYQGTAFKSSGEPLGSTGTAPGPYTASPTNYTMYFRIYDAQSAGTLIYSEQQTVTASLGQFAVKLGSGAAIAGETTMAPPARSIANAFDAKDRYLELTVIIPPASTGTPITPRLAFQSSPFSLVAQRAKRADSVGSDTPGTVIANGAGSSFTGTVNVTGTNSTFTGATITGGTFTNGSFSGTGTGLTALNASNISSGTLNDNRLSTNVAQLDRASQTFTGATNVFNGKVGIGITPNHKLHVYNGNSQSVIDADADVVIEDQDTKDAFLQINAFWQRDAGILFGRPGGARYGAIIYNDTVPGNGLRFLSGNGTRMTIADNGNVGIGTATPASVSKLQVKTGADVNLSILSRGTGPGLLAMNDAATTTLPLSIDGFPLILNSQGANGNVGIGTTTPTQAKLVVNGAVLGTFLTYGKGRDIWENQNPDSNIAWNLSIFASHGILADQFVAGSDARIKDVVGVSDSGSDLTVLQQIAVTDYRYRDWRDKGRGVMKKVIAQQVEKVYPQAVSKSTGVVPDIYQMAGIQDGWVKVATNLKKGERVRLIGEKAEGIHEVLEVAEGKFRTDFKPEGDQVFVYGREVKDFRAVDYEAIAMLNVSATQQIKKEKDAEVKALREENAALKQQLAAQEQRLGGLDAKLAAIEKLLASPGQPAALPVSLKTAAK